MFKSIEYKLILYVLLLLLTVVTTTGLFIRGEYILGMLCVFIVFALLFLLYKNYKRFNQNILFLLNALDNGDYSFHFAETKMSKREQELNKMLNRIKDILSKARKEAIENERFMSVIVESVSTGIVIFDKDNNIVTSNKAVTQILGMPVFTHINQLKNIDETYPKLFNRIKPGEDIQIKVMNEREESAILVRASEIRMKGETLKIVTLSNIGNELEAKEIESWTKLIRVMTHEIMNSVAPITSLTETLLLSYKMNSDKRNSSEEDTIEALETINTTAKGLITFVQSYRQFTGVPKPQKQEVDLIPFLTAVLNLESGVLSEKGIKAEIMPRNIPIILKVDESQINQVLVNLVKNAIEAIKPNSEGQIIIKVTQVSSQLVIDICNNGEPIPEEVIPHIFIPFFTTKESGSGIGLSISRYIMRLHGGNLKHHTKDGWTIFSMVFPI